MRTFLIRCGVAALGIWAMSGCGSSGGLAKDLSAASGDFVVVDLATMNWTTRSAISDLAANPSYRDRYLVFRSLGAGSTVLGSMPGSFGAQGDEARGSASTGRLLLAVFELTQAQWERLAGTTPWNTLPAGVVGVVDGGKAAVGLSHDEVTTALAASGGSSLRFRLPTNTEWERACRAGSGGTFAWGEARDDATVGVHAVVSETAGAVVGPRVVGGRSANAYGFYDLHGNVWELTNEGDIRGGSWRDSLPSARAANAVEIDPITTHPLVGARLIMEFR